MAALAANLAATAAQFLPVYFNTLLDQFRGPPPKPPRPPNKWNVATTLGPYVKGKGLKVKLFTTWRMTVPHLVFFCSLF